MVYKTVVLQISTIKVAPPRLGSYFASATHLCYYESRMSALIFTGDLQEVLPGTLAVRGVQGERCAVCETCKALVCNVLG